MAEKKFDDELVKALTERFDVVFKEEMAAAFKKIDERLKAEYAAVFDEKSLSEEEKKAAIDAAIDQAKKTDADYRANLRKQLAAK